MRMRTRTVAERYQSTMKLRILISILLGCPSLILADLTSGPQVSDPAGPFTVIKCSGAADGVAPGTELCYRSRYGNAPQVIVFTRDASSIAGLAGELDKLAGTHSGFHAYINILGPDPVAAEEAATRLGESAGLKHIPVTVPLENETGPAGYRLNPEAAVTVIVVNNGKVTANHAAVSAGGNLAASVIASAKKEIN